MNYGFVSQQDASKMDLGELIRLIQDTIERYKEHPENKKKQEPKTLLINAQEFETLNISDGGQSAISQIEAAITPIVVAPLKRLDPNAYVLN